MGAGEQPSISAPAGCSGQQSGSTHTQLLHRSTLSIPLAPHLAEQHLLAIEDHEAFGALGPLGGEAHGLGSVQDVVVLAPDDGRTQLVRLRFKVP